MPSTRPKKVQQKKKSAKDDDGFMIIGDPKFDEDVDDDIAFDSDDERQYGDFFAKQKERQKKEKKQQKASSKSSGGELKDTFNDLYDNGADDDDDDGEGFDLSDMLDDDFSSKGDKKKGGAKKSSVALKGGKLKQASARDLVTREGESLFSDANLQSKTTNSAKLSKLVRDVQTTSSNKAEEKIAKRLNKATVVPEAVFDTDVDPEEKDAAQRVQTREKVGEDGKKWAPVLKELRRKKHVQFPLPGAEESAVPQTLGAIASGADPAALSKKEKKKKEAHVAKRNREEESDEPTSQIERSQKMKSTMSDLLVASGLSGRVQNPTTGSAEAKATEKSLLSEKNYVSLDDRNKVVREEDGDDDGDGQPAKVGYVRQLKSMMQYEISKRRRLNKIKSKTYRRILRKEKEREHQQKERELEIINPELAAKKKMDKMAKMRAEERATLKHKNTSKWIKHVKRYSKFDDDTRDAVQDQYREHQRLMEKMEEEAGAQLAEAKADSSSEEEEKQVDRLLATDQHTLRQGGLKSALWGDVQGQGEEASDPTSKARTALREMNFMQRAKERQDAAAEEDFKGLLEDVQRFKEGKAPLHTGAMVDDEDMDPETRAQLAAEDAKALRGDLKGHSVLTRGQSAKERLVEEKRLLKQKAEAAAMKANRNLNTGRKIFGTGHGEEKEANLSALPSRGMLHQVEDAGSDADDEEEEFEEEESESEDEGDAVVGNAQVPKAQKSGVLGGLSVVPPKVSQRKTARLTTKESKPVEAPQADVEHAEQQGEVVQDYLVSRAFAADDVDEEFLKMKEGQVETIMKPQDPNASLPGWGEWGGNDETLNRAHKKRVEKSTLARNIEKSTLLKSRVDSNMNNVIINHDVDLVPTGYALKMVPRPFANAQEFQRSIRQPLGPEWNTATTFRDGVQPRVVTKQGSIIDPLSKRTGTRKAKTSMRKKRGRETEVNAN